MIKKFNKLIDDLNYIRKQGFLQNIDLVKSGTKTNFLVSLAEILEHGAVNNRTKYMSTDEMQAFLSGYLEAKTNNL